MVDIHDDHRKRLRLVGAKHLVEDIHGIAAVAEAREFVAQRRFQRPVALLPQIAQLDAKLGHIGHDTQHPAARQRRFRRQHPASIVQAGFDGAVRQLAAPSPRRAQPQFEIGGFDRRSCRAAIPAAHQLHPVRKTVRSHAQRLAEGRIGKAQLITAIEKGITLLR
ncbi:hypothetical protein D3C86_1745050 [compost metagenome]